MDVIIELDSVASAISAEFPVSAVKYDVPVVPVADTFVVRSQTNDINSETRFSMLIERDYQIIYFSDDLESAIRSIDRLARKCMNGDAVIAISGSFRYIRVGSFSYSQPIETENGLYAIVGVMRTELRQARDQPTFDKIMRVYARIN